jgi:putative spermidine/putrescine transport system permease protein
MKRLRKYMPALLVGGPFLVVMLVFLIWPTLSVVGHAFVRDGHISLFNMQRAITGTYRQSFLMSIKLSFVTSLIGGLIGTAMAILMRQSPVNGRARTFLDAWSAVASQLGGLPLAFAFIALIGTQGLLTRVMKAFGIDLIGHGLSLTNFVGWVFVYLYFQIPFMFLIMTPAISSLKESWFESARSLGASNLRIWRSVGVPILLPSLLTGFVLLFVNAFSAYATVYALSSGAGSLVPLQIRFILQGNVITGEEDLGYSLVTWTLILLVLSLIAVTMLQRRVSRWTESS